MSKKMTNTNKLNSTYNLDDTDKNNNIYVFEDNFSFHTMEYSLSIDKNIFNKVYKYMTKIYGIRAQSEKKRKNKYLYYEWANLKYCGVRVILSKPNGYIKNDFFKYKVKLIVNPRSLISGKNEYFGIFKTTLENILKLKSLLDEITYDIGLVQENDTEYWKNTYGTIDIFKLTRIDFCVNFIFDSADIAKDYLEILNRGDIYDFNSGESVFEAMRERHRKYKNELLYEYKSFNLKIYNKFEQMRNIGKADLIPVEYEGYLRFEMCAEKEKIKYLIKKYDYDENNTVTFLSNASREAKKQFKRYVTFLFKTGVFMNLKNAREYAKYCKTDGLINSRQAEEIIDFLNLVSEKRSIYKAKQCVESKITEKRIFRLFDEISLNPITIPEIWNQKGRKYPFLPSPYEIMGFKDDELFNYQ